MAEIIKEVPANSYVTYMGKPLVREDNTIVYGNLSDKCYLQLEIMKKAGASDTIFIQVIDSKDPTKIIKQGQKSSLYDAFSLGVIWLEQALK